MTRTGGLWTRVTSVERTLWRDKPALRAMATLMAPHGADPTTVIVTEIVRNWAALAPEKDLVPIIVRGTACVMPEGRYIVQ